MMTTVQISKHREALLEMRSRIRGQTETITQALQNEGRAPGDLSHVPTHPADRDSEGLDADLELKRSEESMLDDIEDALRRIDDGSYGKCVSCGHAIARERLDILPYAAECVRCASKSQPKPR